MYRPKKRRTQDTTNMECQHFQVRITILSERPNILQFKQIRSAYQKQNLEKLCKFIVNIYTIYVNCR